MIFRDSQLNKQDSKDSFSFKQRDDIILEEESEGESTMKKSQKQFFIETSDDFNAWVSDDYLKQISNEQKIAL